MLVLVSRVRIKWLKHYCLGRKMEVGNEGEEEGEGGRERKGSAL